MAAGLRPCRDFVVRLRSVLACSVPGVLEANVIVLVDLRIQRATLPSWQVDCRELHCWERQVRLPDLPKSSSISRSPMTLMLRAWLAACAGGKARCPCSFSAYLLSPIRS